MFCQKCGAENNDAASFCNNCGSALVPIPTQSATSPKRKNDVIAPDIHQREELEAELVSESGSPPVSPERKHGILFWVAVIFVFIIGALIIGRALDPPSNMSKYCYDNYPGTVYNPSTNECDHIPTVTPTLSQIRSSSYSSSSNSDVAVLNKMSEMSNWMTPTMETIADSLTYGEYTKAGLNAVLLRTYIDQNLPEMRQLANGATTKKAAAQEFVLFLEDMRSASNKVVQCVDAFNSRDYTTATNYAESGTIDTNNAKAHLIRATTLL
ncbi:MAG: zinc ribbon domain-containing protein [Methanoregula sp.]